MTEQEKTLIARCVKGEKAAWDTFVQQYSNLVYHTIRKTLNLYRSESGGAVVEDLFQEFFLSILHDDCKKLRQFRGDHGCSLASWLRIVAARLAIDFLRKQNPSTVDMLDSLAADQPNAPDTLIGQEQEKLLTHALAGLSERDRLIIELSYRRSLSPREIASVLNISIGAFYTQKSRVLDKLREILG